MSTRMKTLMKREAAKRNRSPLDSMSTAELEKYEDDIQRIVDGLYRRRLRLELIGKMEGSEELKQDIENMVGLQEEIQETLESRIR